MISKCLILSENALSATPLNGFFSNTKEKKGSAFATEDTPKNESDFLRSSSLKLYSISNKEELRKKLLIVVFKADLLWGLTLCYYPSWRQLIVYR